MTRRHIHYEAAFEDYVRSRGWPYVPVLEQRRIIFSGARVKSFDLMVYPPTQLKWLVDVKGRKFPYDLMGGKRFWENWVTRADLDGLSRWEAAFGEGFSGVFVFAYWLTTPAAAQPTVRVHKYKEQYYSFLWVSVRAYAAVARGRSTKWDTLSLPTKAFRELAKPLDEI